MHPAIICCRLSGLQLLHVVVAYQQCQWVYMQETCVVMEWCEKGSLQSAVSDGIFHVHGSEWGHDAIMPIISATLLDIATGMAYLHKMHVLHCDLKLRNVLLKLAQVTLLCSSVLICLVCAQSLRTSHLKLKLAERMQS